MWAWRPTSSTDGGPQGPLDGVGGRAARQAEAELGVVLAGPHELVGVGLDAGRDPQQHRRHRAGPRRGGRRGGRARRSCRRRCGPTPAVERGRAARRATCCCRGAPGGRPARRRPAPRAARRRWPRRAAGPPRGRGGPWPGRGRPWWRRRRSGAEGGDRLPAAGPQVGLVVDEQRRAELGGQLEPGRTPPIEELAVGADRGVVGQERRRDAAQPGSHRLGRGHAEQVEADRQPDAGRLDQPQPGLGQLGRHVVAHHVAVVVEAVERRRPARAPRS